MPAAPPVTTEDERRARLHAENKEVTKLFGAEFPKWDPWTTEWPKYTGAVWWDILETTQFHISTDPADFDDMSLFFWTSGLLRSKPAKKVRARGVRV